MRSKRNLAAKIIMRTVGLFFLGLFLQWVGTPEVTTQEGTVYSQIAHLVGAGAPGVELAKLPPQ